MTTLLSEKAPVASPSFIGDIVTSASKPNGGNVLTRITNTGASGFSSYYLNAPSEECQIFTGQSTGLNLRTGRAHPIRFITFSNQGTVTESMSILGSGSRDVVINTPLMLKVHQQLLNFL